MAPPVSPQLSLENVAHGDRLAARACFIAWRQQIAPDLRADWDVLLCERLWLTLEPLLSSLLELRQKAHERPVVAAYWPIRAEPDLTQLYQRLWTYGAHLALPKVIGKQSPLEFGLMPENGRRVTAGFGVQIPEPFEPVTPDLMIIPCVAFHPNGYRLGYGGGYYDRTLANLRVPAFGVAYDACEWADWQPQPHDIRLTGLVTERRSLSERGAHGTS